MPPRKVLSLSKQYSTQKFGIPFHLEQPVRADFLAVICPLVSEEMSEQALEAAAIDVENAAELVALATAAAFGKWREDRSVMLTKTRQVAVQLTRDVPLFLDGERVVGKKAEISFVSDAVNVIVPKPNQGILLFTDFKCKLLQRGVRIY